MSKKFGAALAVVLAMAWAQAQSAPVTYMVSIEGIDASSTLTGSITLKDGAVGPIGANDILSWSFASTGDPALGAPVFSISSPGGLGPVDCLDDDFCFSATASQLIVSGNNSAQFSTFGAFAHQVSFGTTSTIGVNFAGWKSFSPSASDRAQLPQSGVFAQADPSASVPEPGSLALAGAALAAAFVTAGRRYRRGSTAAT